MNHIPADPQELTDWQRRVCDVCGDELREAYDHGDAECRDVLADRIVWIRSEAARERREHRLRLEKIDALRRELLAEQTWAARLEGALAMHDCALLGDMRRKYRGGPGCGYDIGTGEPYWDGTTSAAALAEPNE